MIRRLLTLLLTCTLLLQASWAAAHFCHDELSAGLQPNSSVAAAGPTGAAGDGSVPADGHEACCAVGHACHGLLHLAAPASEALPAPDRVAAAPRIALVQFPPDWAGTAIERPRWSAA